MFSIFKKKAPGIKVIDRVVIDETAKWNMLFNLWQTQKDIALICWFEDSLQKAEQFFANKTAAPITILLAREATAHSLSGKTPYFIEHYPLRSKELLLYEKLKLEKAIVFSSLREPLFKQFGGDKIIELMLKLGMKEDEMIEHNMISNAIQKAQEKIENNVQIESPALSQTDWLKKNTTA